MCHPDVPKKGDAHEEARQSWLKNYVPKEQIHHWCRPELGLVETWDTAVSELVIKAPKHITEVLFLHDDTVPDDRSVGIWDYDADAVCCRYDVPDRPWLWRGRRSFHNAMCRIQRKVFEVVPQPWWDWRRHPEAGNAVSCHCEGFARRIQSYLYTTANTGECQHYNMRRAGARMPKSDPRQSPPITLSYNLWKRNYQMLRDKKAKRLKEIRNGK